MPNGGFRGLLSNAMTQDVQVRGAASLAQSLPLALAQIEQKRTAAREEAVSARNVARSALYQKRPEMAAKTLGMEYTAPTTPEIGEGYRKPKITVDEQGNVTRSYEPAVELDAEFFAKEYNKWSVAVDELNVNRKLLKQEEIPKLSFKNWMQETFPEYAPEVLGRGKGKQPRISKTPFDLTDEGSKYADSVDDLIAYYQEENPGLSEQEIIDAMKTQGLIR